MLCLHAVKKAALHSSSPQDGCLAGHQKYFCMHGGMRSCSCKAAESTCPDVVLDTQLLANQGVTCRGCPGFSDVAKIVSKTPAAFSKWANEILLCASSAAGNGCLIAKGVSSFL